MGKPLQFTIMTFSVFVSLILIIPSGNVLAHSWEAPKIEAQRKNPTPLTPSSITSGKATFLELCSHCHGDNAKGLKSKETGLKKNTGNLYKRLKDHSDGDFYWKIQNGKGEMPSFSKELTETQTWDIINYIRNTGNQNAK
jgi:mono/diheme cytochrome c family protein